ncbi:MAG: hypothetical protein ACI4DN_01845, partial [Lachnospiraceae bacterium]
RGEIPLLLQENKLKVGLRIRSSSHWSRISRPKVGRKEGERVRITQQNYKKKKIKGIRRIV